MFPAPVPSLHLTLHLFIIPPFPSHTLHPLPSPRQPPKTPTHLSVTSISRPQAPPSSSLSTPLHYTPPLNHCFPPSPLHQFHSLDSITISLPRLHSPNTPTTQCPHRHRSPRTPSSSPFIPPTPLQHTHLAPSTTPSSTLHTTPYHRAEVTA